MQTIYDIAKTKYEYNPTNGEVTNRKTGRSVGSKTSQGYLAITVCHNTKKVKLCIHRFAWFYMTGTIPDVVDHIDQDKHNNAFTNLRNTSQLVNQKNCKKTKNRTLPLGVSRFRNKYRARYMVDGVEHVVGYYITPEEAEIALKLERKNHGFTKNHGN